MIPVGPRIPVQLDSSPDNASADARCLPHKKGNTIVWYGINVGSNGWLSQMFAAMAILNGNALGSLRTGYRLV